MKKQRFESLYFLANKLMMLCGAERAAKLGFKMYIWVPKLVSEALKVKIFLINMNLPVKFRDLDDIMRQV